MTLPRGEPYSPAILPATERQHYGIFRAVVMGYADHLGRMKVRIPQVFGKREVTAEACFQPGIFLLPEVGAQVWVTFENGDCDYPVVVGWRPTEDKLPRWAGYDITEDKLPNDKKMLRYQDNWDKNIGQVGVIWVNASATSTSEDARGSAEIILRSYGWTNSNPGYVVIPKLFAQRWLGIVRYIYYPWWYMGRKQFVWDADLSKWVAVGEEVDDESA